MPNNFSAFFETLVAGADEYNKAKVGRTALLDAVYKDVKPEAARIGKTVDVYFPDVGPLSAINNGQLTPTSVNPNYIPLVFQTRAGAALQFQDFEQWQTAVDLAQKFFDPLYKRAQEYLNGQIAALITHVQLQQQRPDHRSDAGRSHGRRPAQRLGNAGGPESAARRLWNAPAPLPQPASTARCSVTRSGSRRAWFRP